MLEVEESGVISPLLPPLIDTKQLQTVIDFVSLASSEVIFFKEALWESVPFPCP